MDLIVLDAVLGDFFEGGDGPSHDQLDRAVARAGLSAGDPAPVARRSQGLQLGKTKRIRQVLVHATDHDPAAGVRLAQHVVSLLRARSFQPTRPKLRGGDKGAAAA